MGMSIDFYAADPAVFNAWRRAQRKEERLAETAASRHKDVLDAFDRKFTEWYSNKHSKERDKPRLRECEWMDKDEFIEWYDAHEHTRQLMEGPIVKLPQMTLSNDFWLVQWTLDRFRKRPDGTHLRTDMNGCPWFVFEKDDIAELVEKLSCAKKGREAFLSSFPVYADLPYAKERDSDYGKEREEQVRKLVLPRFRNALDYARKNIVGGYIYTALVMEIYP